ncbi:MAG: hypothetical protein WDO69_26380 [Pseudomonadota bacterium]
MNRHPLTLTALGITLCLGAACSSNSDQHAPSLGSGGASSHGGAGGRASVGKSGAGGSVDGGAAGESDDGGAAGAAGSVGGEGGAGGSFEEGMIIPVAPGACSEDAEWANPTPLDGISTDANEQLLAITPDELDILFVRDQSVMRAHRDLASAAFGVAEAMTIPDGYAVDAGVALSADGKTLVLLATTGQSFAAFTRTSRSASFDATPDDTAFTGINQRALQTMQHYAAPVLAPDGKSFVFAAFTPEPTAGFPAGFAGVSVVYESTWTMNGWAMPDSISQDLFDGTTAARALPSALSSDSRTLFYLDEGNGKQMARFRDRPDAPLYTVVDLDTRTGAVPDAKCDRLYYSSDGNVLVAAD